VAIKLRLGERRNPESHPRPTLARPWSRASDRFLGLGTVCGIAGALVWILDPSAGLVWRMLGAAGGVAFAGTAWIERRRRLRTEGG
jgi:hypothetical protein